MKEDNQTINEGATSVTDYLAAWQNQEHPEKTKDLDDNEK
jgi:hypothetical protein